MQISMLDIILQTLGPLIPILGILVTTLVSIIAIRKTAEANRVSAIHNEMLHCIIDSIESIRKVRVLLYNISRKTSYFRLPNNQFIETAYDRYWREIQDISEEFNLNQSKQKFVLPKKLYEKMQKLIDKINKAKNEVKDLKPDQNNIYPDTQELEKIVKEITSLYVDFVHEARIYVGADALTPFSTTKEHILGIEEAKEKNNKS